MLILRHSRDPGVSLYEWCNSFGPLIRTYLRASDVEYLGGKELQRINKCITSQITDFEQATLAQISDKWKPITLAEGMFDLDELKRDISISDAKFSVFSEEVQAYSSHLGILDLQVSNAAGAPSYVHDGEFLICEEETFFECASRQTHEAFQEG